MALQPKSANTVSVGANIQSTDEIWFPDTVSVNGVKCTIANAPAPPAVNPPSPTPAKPSNPSPPPPKPVSSPPPPPPPPAATCDAAVSLGYPWSEGAKRFNTVSLVCRAGPLLCAALSLVHTQSALVSMVPFLPCYILTHLHTLQIHLCYLYRAQLFAFGEQLLRKKFPNPFYFPPPCLLAILALARHQSQGCIFSLSRHSICNSEASSNDSKYSWAALRGDLAKKAGIVALPRNQLGQQALPEQYRAG